MLDQSHSISSQASWQIAVRLTIGKAGTWKIPEARAEGRRLQVLIDRGIDLTWSGFPLLKMIHNLDKVIKSNH